MDTTALVLDAPRRLRLERMPLPAVQDADVVVDVHWSGVSAGTEKLLWTGEMPPFPGLAYPLVPGYEAVGRITQVGATSGRTPGEWVFVPGASCFGSIRGLFGADATRLVVPADRPIRIRDTVGAAGSLLALAATALHALRRGTTEEPLLVVGHGALGQLIARLATALGTAPPVVWEINPDRRAGRGYAVIAPDDDDAGRRYACVIDASGHKGILNTAMPRLLRGGTIVLAGFYSRLTFDFVPAFLREAQVRVAAEWTSTDLHDVARLVDDGTLDLDGIITHRIDARRAPSDYANAFQDPTCVKLLLDWREMA